MDKTLQTTAWNCLPREFKEEVKKIYQEAENGWIVEDTLENIFGIHNLISDAEGEEMLTVPRKKVQEKWQRAYEQEEKYSRAQDSPIAREELYYNRGIMSVIDTLFGSKCLPDEEEFAENANCDKSSDNPQSYKTKADTNHFVVNNEMVDRIIKDSFSKERRLNIAAMAMQGLLSNTTRFSSYEISDLVRISLNCADALITESKKGGLQ